MRVAVIVVTMLVVTTPSGASQSCMSKAEARQHFPSVHLYWHSPGHCWDADATSAPRHQSIPGVQPRTPIREVQRKNDQPRIDQPGIDQPGIDQPKIDQAKTDQAKTDQPKIDHPKIDQPKIDQPKWRDSISEVLAESGPEQTTGESRGARYDGNGDTAGTPWVDRWVDVGTSSVAGRTVGIAPVASPPIVEGKAEPLITLRGVVLVCISMVLALATFEVLFVGAIYQRAKSG
jgi:hypothetical protein